MTKNRTIRLRTFDIHFVVPQQNWFSARPLGLALPLAIWLLSLAAHASTPAGPESLPENLVLKVQVNMNDSVLGSSRRSTEERTLMLTRYTIRATNYTLEHWQDGESKPVIAPAVRTYRGWCKEEPNERVCAVIYPNGTLDACGTTGMHWVWEIGKPVDVSKQIKTVPAIPVARDHWPFGTATKMDKPAELHDGRDRWPGGTLVKRDKAPAPLINLPPSRAIKRAQVMADITDTCVNQQRTGGGWEAAVAWVDWHGLIADEMYTRNLGISLEFTGGLVRMSPFYELPENKGQELPRLAAFWKPFYEKGGFDYVTGFTRQYAGGLAGICAPYSYGVFWHELGHNLGLNHDLYGFDMQNPLCWARALHRLEKNGQYQRFVDTKPNDRHEPVHPRSNPDVIVTTPDLPVHLRVLANDFDGNGESIRLSYFTELTKRGGRVTYLAQSESTGLRLDDLCYTPPKGFIGKDAVIYSVENKSGLHSTEIVHIYVIDPRAPYAAQWPMDRVDASRSPDLEKAQRHAVLPPGAVVIAGAVNSAVEIPAGSRILLGHCEILPDRPKDFRPIGEFGSSRWYPLEPEIGNDFDPLNQSYTLAFWFRRTENGDTKSSADPKKPEPDDSRGVLVEKKNTQSTNGAAGFRIQAKNESLVLTISEFCGEADRGELKLTHQEALKPGIWHHLAVVVDRSGAPEARLYLDGVPSKDKLSLIKGSFIFSGRTELQLCASDYTKTAFDEVKVAYRALNASLVSALYQQGALRVKHL